MGTAKKWRLVSRTGCGTGQAGRDVPNFPSSIVPPGLTLDCPLLAWRNMCNHGAEMMAPWMPECSGFFVYAGIAVKSVGLCEIQGHALRVRPLRHFAFWP